MKTTSARTTDSYCTSHLRSTHIVSRFVVEYPTSVFVTPWPRGKLLSRMPIWLRTCSRMLLSVPPRLSRNTTSRRTLPHTSRKNSTRSTTPHGIALLEGTSDLTLPTRPSTSSTSILARANQVKPSKPWPRGKLLSRMPIWLRTCSRMLSSVPPRLSRNTTSRRTLLHTSRRSSTRSTTPHGIALLEGTSDLTLPTRPSTSSTSILARLPSFSSRADRYLSLPPPEHDDDTYFEMN
eukprot:sb/3469253/